MADQTIDIDILINTAKSAKSLEQQRAALKGLREGLDQVREGSGAFELLSEEVTNLTKEMGFLNLSFEDAYGNIKPLTSQIGELEDRLYQMALAGQQNTDEFKQIQTEVVKLKKSLRDVDDEIDAFVQRGAKLQGFIKIVQGIAGGFAVAQSGLKLFGVESKNVEKSLERTATVIELLSGLEALSTALKEKNVIVTGIQNGLRAITVRLAGQEAVAEAAAAAAKGTATVAQRALNAAMAANPIGILVTLILSGVAALTLWTSSTEDATEANDELNKSIEKRNSTLEALNAQETKGLEARKNAAIANLEIQKSEIEKSIALLELKTDRTAAENAKLNNLNDQLKNKNIQIIEEEKKAALEQLDYEKKVNAERLNLLKKDAEDKQRLASRDPELQKEADDAALAYRKAFLDENLKASTIALSNGNIVEGEYLARRTAINQEAIQKTAEIRNNAIVKEASDDKKAKDEALKRQKDYVANLLESINELINRNKDASNELRKLKADEIEDLKAKELELQSIRFSEQTQNLVDKAIARELKANEDKFKNLEIDQKTFEAKREAIINDGTKFLTASEKALYDYYIKLNGDRNKAIENRFVDEAKITEAETKKIRAQLALMDYEYANSQKKLSDEVVKSKQDEAQETKKSLEKEIENRQKSIDLAKQELSTTEAKIKKQEEYKAADKDQSDAQKEAYDDSIKKIKEEAVQIENTIKLSEEELAAKKKLAAENELLINDYVKAKEEGEKKSVEAVKKSTSEETKLRQDLLDASEALLTEQYNQEINKKGLTEEQKKKITAQYELDIANLRKSFTDQNIKGIEDVNKALKENGTDLTNWYQKLTDGERATFDQTVKFITDTAQLIADVQQRVSDQRIANIEREKDARLEQYDFDMQIAEMQRNNAEIADYQEFIRQQEIADNRAAIEEEYNAKIREEKRRAFNAQKAADLIQIGINTAVAVSKVLANPIVAALVGFAGAAQAAFVATQPTPEFARGGLLDGPSHAEGGIATPFGEMEGGEAVINKKSTKMFKPLLSAINEAGGGVKFADGAVLPTTPVMQTYNDNGRIDRLESMLERFASKPILTYVNESDVTRAQRNQQKINKRTSF